MADNKAHKKLKKARMRLEGSSAKDYEDGNPFFAYLARHLNMKQNPDIPTMGVDFQGNMYYNPEFVHQLSLEETQAVLTHEVMHLALHGRMRKGSREHQLWNIAQDIVINHILNKNNLQLPREGVNVNTGEEVEYPVPRNGSIKLDSLDLKIDNIGSKNFEQVYAILDKEVPDNKLQQQMQGQQQQGEGDSQQGQGQGQGEGQSQRIQDAVGDNPLGVDTHIYEDEDNEEEGHGIDKEDGEDWEEIVSNAMAKAKTMGKTPQGVERMVDDLLNPSFNWKTILRKYISRNIANDYTWQRPSKKTRALQKQGINTYMPDTEKEGLNIAVALDTSGSVTDQDLAYYLGEIKSIAQQYNSVNITILHHDTKVHKTEKLEHVQPQDIKDITPEGGGGTDHRPVFQKLQEDSIEADALICFTDGYTTTPDQPPQDIDTIWALDNHRVEEDRLGFGRILRAETPDQQ